MRSSVHRVGFSKLAEHSKDVYCENLVLSATYEDEDSFHCHLTVKVHLLNVNTERTRISAQQFWRQQPLSEVLES